MGFLKKVMSYSPLEKMLGDGGSGALFENIAQQKEYSKKLEEAYNGNESALKDLIARFEKNADNYSVDIDEDLKSVDETYKKADEDMLSKMANSGFTYGSNDAIAKNSAALTSEKAKTQSSLRNQANKEKYNVQNGMLNNLANLNQQMYGNKVGSLGGASSALTNAYNAQAAWGANQRNQIIGLLGGAFSGLGGFLGD